MCMSLHLTINHLTSSHDISWHNQFLSACTCTVCYYQYSGMHTVQVRVIHYSVVTLSLSNPQAVIIWACVPVLIIVCLLILLTVYFICICCCCCCQQHEKRSKASKGCCGFLVTLLILLSLWVHTTKHLFSSLTTQIHIRWCVFTELATQATSLKLTHHTCNSNYYVIVLNSWLNPHGACECVWSHNGEWSVATVTVRCT